MANPTAAPLEAAFGGQSRKGSYISEIWILTGSTSGVGSSVAITPRQIKRPLAAIGPVSYAISGQAITVTMIADLASGVTAIEIIGRP